MKKRFIAVLIFVILLSVGSSRAIAGDYNAAEKLGRGIANFFTGWVEIPAEFGRVIEKKGDLAAVFVAPFTGIAKAIGRTAVGLYDALTFPIPFPSGYKPVIEPEFVLQDTDSVSY